jgi:hypothetical protein
MTSMKSWVETRVWIMSIHLSTHKSSLINKYPQMTFENFKLMKLFHKHALSAYYTLHHEKNDSVYLYRVYILARDTIFMQLIVSL